MEVGVTEEQLLAGQVAVSDADIADVTARTRRMDRLQHRFDRSDGFDDRVGPQPVGEVFDPGGTVVTARFDDVGRTELACESLSWLVAAHHDDPLGAELL